MAAWVRVKSSLKTYPKKEAISLMSKSITQDLSRQSLMKYALKYGVSPAESITKVDLISPIGQNAGTALWSPLLRKSRRPHSHPNQHSADELDLIRRMRRRNPTLGLIELWFRLRKRGYSRCPESLFHVLKRMGLFPPKKLKQRYVPKPYEQMTAPGERVQVDVKVVPRSCIVNNPELRLFQYTAIDEFTRLRFLGAYQEQSTTSSADFLRKLCAWYARKRMTVKCVQTDNGTEFTNRFVSNKQNLPSLFEKTAAELKVSHKLIRPYTPRHNGKAERSHKEDQKRFYSCHAFYSLEDFKKQLELHNRNSNNIPMRPLLWLSPRDFAVQHV